MIQLGTNDKMDPELKEEWVAALRSGKYEQGIGTLRSESGKRFCCLGVLCDILEPEGWELTPHNITDGNYYFHTLADLGGALIHKQFLKEFGIKGSAACNLAQLNDDDRYTFEMIANVIEKEL